MRTHILQAYIRISSWICFRSRGCAAQGGVTTVMPYIRSGLCYLNEGGSYKTLYKKFLTHAENNYHCDYSYHVSPIEEQHIGEMEWLIRDQGVVSLGEVFMFYGQHSLHGASTKEKQNDFLQLKGDEKYDLGFYDFMLREMGKIAQENRIWPNLFKLAFTVKRPSYYPHGQKKCRVKALRVIRLGRTPGRRTARVWLFGQQHVCPQKLMYPMSISCTLRAKTRWKR